MIRFKYSVLFKKKKVKSVFPNIHGGYCIHLLLLSLELVRGESQNALGWKRP